METYQRSWDSAESSSGINLVIEDLDEFAVGRSGFCWTCTADYAIPTSAPATLT